MYARSASKIPQSKNIASDIYLVSGTKFGPILKDTATAVTGKFSCLHGCHNVGKECNIQIKVYFYVGKDIACHADIMSIK